MLSNALVLITFLEQCYCGTKDDFDVLTASDACAMTDEASCFGDAYEICGGESVIRVYSKSIVALDTWVEYEYVGCYSDGRYTRMMDELYESSSLTAEVSETRFVFHNSRVVYLRSCLKIVCFEIRRTRC